MIGRKFSGMAEAARQNLNGQIDQPFGYRPKEPAAKVAARVAQIVTAIEATPYGRGHARRLADFVMTGQEVDVVKVRPLALAAQWGIDPREAVELCL